MQSKTGTIRADPVRLKWSEKDRAVLLEPEDEDRFVMTVKEVIQACNASQRASEFEAQFDDLKNLLGNWLHQQKGVIHKAFITVRDSRILFLTVTEQVEHDPKFDDVLSDLDLKIAETPFVSAIPLSVQSLPRCNEDVYSSFLSLPILLEYEMS